MHELLPRDSWSIILVCIGKGSQGHLISNRLERLIWSLLEEIFQSTEGLANDVVFLLDLCPQVCHLRRASLELVSV